MCVCLYIYIVVVSQYKRFIQIIHTQFSATLLRPIVECRYCHAFDHILEHCLTHPPRPKGGFSKSKIMSNLGSSSFIVAATTEGSTFVTMSDLEAMVKQVISSNSSIAMSTTPGNSPWFFYSVCCNHMTTDINILSSKTPISSLPPIRTVNGTKMTITHTSYITTPNLSLPETYHIPNLTFNLISVGQLCEKELTIIFFSSGVQVQDSQTGQILRTSRKMGRLFELASFHLPQKFMSVVTTINSSIHQ